VYVKHVVKLLASSCGMLAPVGSLVDAKMSGSGYIHACTVGYLKKCSRRMLMPALVSPFREGRRETEGHSRFVQSLMISIIS